MYGVVVMLWMKQWKCRGHLIAAHWGSTQGQLSHRKWKQRIKDNPCTQGFGGKLSSKAARSGKALELSMMDLNWKLDFQATAHGWEQTGETSSFSYWYKLRAVQSSPWSMVRESHQTRVIREAAGGREEWGQVQRDGLGPRQWWFSVSSTVSLPEMYRTPSNRSRIQGWNERVKAGWNN